MNNIIGFVLEDPRKQWDLQRGLNDFPGDLDGTEDVYLWSYPREKSKVTFPDGRIQYDKVRWHRTKSAHVIAWLEKNCIGVRMLEPEETLANGNIWLYTAPTDAPLDFLSGELSFESELERNLERLKQI